MSHVPMTCQFECAATELGVRDLMAMFRHALVDHHVTGDLQSSVEIAVTEGLNNIVEHALSGRPQAQITVELAINAAHVFVQMRDDGAAMPGWQPPKGREADLNVARDALPEGGFGWGMIHALTDQLDYSRINGVNRLKMWFQIQAGPQVGRAV